MVQKPDENNQLGLTAGNWLGWIGVVAALIGFFWQPVWMGGIAIVLGVIGLFSPAKAISWTAIALGIVSLLFPVLFG